MAAYPVPPGAVMGGYPSSPYPMPPGAVIGPWAPGTGPAIPKPAAPGEDPGVGSTNPGQPVTDGTDGSGGHTKRQIPSIEEILGADPFYAQLEALYKAMGLDEHQIADMKLARIKSLYGNANDPISLFGRAKESYEDRLRRNIYSLVAHGMLFSGETGWQQNRASLDYARAQYDLNFRLQEYVEGVKEGLAQADRQRQLQLIQAKADAVQRWIADNMETA